MISLDLLSNAHLSYYLDLAREDYYFKGGEPPGQWWGSGADFLGLKGKVTKKQLRAMYQGELLVGKKTVSLCQKQRNKKHRPGIGMVFSCPKSVSVMWARGNRRQRKYIEQLTEEAARCALKYAEKHLIPTRRGHGGKQLEACRLIAALFQHGTNRELEPNLHIHSLIMNACVRFDKTTGTIVNDLLFQNKKLLGAIFRAQLAYLLEREMGYYVERDREDYFRLTGVPKKLCDHFSTPRNRIEVELSRLGLSGAKSAEKINLKHRRLKEDTPARKQLHKKWHDECVAMGFDENSERASIRYRQIDRKGEWELATKEALERVVRYRSRFTKYELALHLAVCLQGRGLSSEDLHEQVKKILNDESLVLPLGGTGDDQRYTTPPAILSELDVIDRSSQLAASDQGVHVPLAKVYEAVERYEIHAQEKGYSHSPEKATAVRKLLDSRARLRLLNGKSGAAKTSTVKAVAHQLKQSGFKVVGAAPTGRAAEVLKKQTGIRSGTIHGLLGIRPDELSEDYQHPEPNGQFRSHDGRIALSQPITGRPSSTSGRMWNERLCEKSVVIIDEASMIGSPLMKETLRKIDESGATAILMGDYRQKQAIERGGCFKSLLSRIEHVELNEIVRQKDPQDRKMVEHAANRDPGKALKMLVEKERLWVGQSREDTLDSLLEQWNQTAKWSAEDHLILATTNVEVDLLNRRCQLLKQKPSTVPELRNMTIYDSHRKRPPAVLEQVWERDRIVVTASRDVPLGNGTTHVTNGSFGTVHDVRTDGTIKIRLDDGRLIRVCPRRFAHLRLGYAATSYKAQGCTIKNVSALLGEHTKDMNDFYVQVSRFKEELQVFVDEPTLGGKLLDIENSRLAKRLAEAEEDVMAIEDYLLKHYSKQAVPSLLERKVPTRAVASHSSSQAKHGAAQQAMEDKPGSDEVDTVLEGDDASLHDTVLEEKSTSVQSASTQQVCDSSESDRTGIKTVESELVNNKATYIASSGDSCPLPANQETAPYSSRIEEMPPHGSPLLQAVDAFFASEDFYQTTTREESVVGSSSNCESLSEPATSIISRSSAVPAVAKQADTVLDTNVSNLDDSNLPRLRHSTPRAEVYVKQRHLNHQLDVAAQKERKRIRKQQRNNLPPPKCSPQAIAQLESLAFMVEGGLLTAEALVTAKASVRSQVEEFARVMWWKTSSTGHLLWREIIKPTSRYAWRVVKFPSELWEKFRRSEEKRLKELREALWQEKNRKKNILEKAGQFFKEVFSPRQISSADDEPRKIPPEELGCRFFLFLLNQSLEGVERAAHALWGLMEGMWLSADELATAGNVSRQTIKDIRKALQVCFVAAPLWTACTPLRALSAFHRRRMALYDAVHHTISTTSSLTGKLANFAAGLSSVVLSAPLSLIEWNRKRRERLREEERQQREERERQWKEQEQKVKERERKRKAWYDSLSPAEQAAEDERRLQAERELIEYLNAERSARIAQDTAEKLAATSGGSGYTWTPYTPYEPPTTTVPSTSTVWQPYANTTIHNPPPTQPINNAEQERSRIAVGGAQWEQLNRPAPPPTAVHVWQQTV